MNFIMMQPSGAVADQEKIIEKAIRDCIATSRGNSTLATEEDQSSSSDSCSDIEDVSDGEPTYDDEDHKMVE